MSFDFNQVTLIGHLGQSPEIIQKGNESSFAKIQIATNKVWFKDNTKTTRTDWHSIILNGRFVRVAQELLSKGDKVFIQGELRTKKWQDKEGNARLSIFVTAQELILLEKSQKETTVSASTAQYSEAKEAKGSEFIDEGAESTDYFDDTNQ